MQLDSATSYSTSIFLNFSGHVFQELRLQEKRGDIGDKNFTQKRLLMKS